MLRTIQLTLLALVVAALSSCLGGRPIKYFTVSVPPAPKAAAIAYPVDLLVGSVNAPEMLEDQPIVYRSGRNEVGAYQYHLWAEPPAQMIRSALIRRLQSSGQYQSVARLGGSTHGDFVLRGRLYDFEEIDTGGAITARVTMEFVLVDLETHKAVWNHFYSRTVPVQGREVSDVVAALDSNLDQGLNEVQTGLGTYFASHLPPKS